MMFLGKVCSHRNLQMKIASKQKSRTQRPARSMRQKKREVFQILRITSISSIFTRSAWFCSKTNFGREKFGGINTKIQNHDCKSICFI